MLGRELGGHGVDKNIFWGALVAVLMWDKCKRCIYFRKNKEEKIKNVEEEQGLGTVMPRSTLNLEGGTQPRRGDPSDQRACLFFLDCLNAFKVTSSLSHTPGDRQGSGLGLSALPTWLKTPDSSGSL